MSTLPESASSMGLQPFGQSGTGRSIMANGQLHGLLEGYKELSSIPSSEGYHALAITSAVNSLRGGVAPVNSFLKEGSSTRRCVIGAGFEIEYELNNYYGGPQTDVVIIDIRLTGDQSESRNRAALWNANFSSSVDRWISKDAPEYILEKSSKVSGSKESPFKIGINGYSRDLDHAINILPSHISRGDTNNLNKLKENGYLLFYVPQKGALKSGWRCVRNLGKSITREDLEAARILANHMKEAHDKNYHVEWTSHRGGSKVLTEAMKLLAQRQVDLAGKQKVFLSDHTSSQYAADVVRRKIGMNTDDATWNKSTPGIAQLIGGKNLGTADLAISANTLFKHTEKENRPGQAVDTLHHGRKLYKAGKKAVLTGTGAWTIVTTLSTKFGISFTMAQTIVGLLGLSAAQTILSSIPSLNEGYHKSAAEPSKQLAQKLFSKK
ncbi:hypothetical protein ACJJIG_10155 [Microbulbifer sp. SSSA007]|uniref:hypothetical protein n=1 Tax=Microbulbifer sp. SSSA007 TaxID=3243379 RepID=UPI00403A6D44